MMILSRRLNARVTGGAVVRKFQACPKFLSTSTGDVAEKVTTQPEEPKEVLVYTAKYCNKMKWLRRISLGSSFASIMFLVSLEC